ncbi:transcriptional regulator, partial [Klebsiella pneumoniae]|nr:transcriptional regulator [Klebsiella pneumoniae]
FAGKKSAQIREILINESAWEEMTCLFALSLIENSSNHGSDLMANKPEEGEKVSERLHVTFKIPIWLIALIVVMIVINIIVLVVLNR